MAVIKDRLAAFSEMPPNADALLITSEINRRYYLNFSSSAGALLVINSGGKTKNYFIIDSRYFEAAAETVKNCEVILQDKLYEQITKLLKDCGAKQLSIEADKVSLTEYERLKEKLSTVKILRDDALSRMIERQKSVKSEDEIKSIQLAQDISDRTFSHILGFIKTGMTELDIAIELEQFSRREGSEQPAFSFIVAAGKNSSRPHAVPSDNKVQDGDFITLDFGSTVDGYRSDMTRTVAVGSVSQKQREVYELVLKAQLEAMKKIKAGAICRDIDKVARDIIDATAYKGLFGHGLGHSLGLEIHEDPRFNTLCEQELQAGTVMSVEPGIYIPGEFGVRIEDIVAATEDGYHNFVKSDKSLIII